jgi:hypothetical protein
MTRCETTAIVQDDDATRPTAARLRHRRAQAAQALSATSQRHAISWAALSQCPEWIASSCEMRDALAWAAGAWRHRWTLRMSIDGSALARVRQRLGDSAFCALIGEAGSDEAIGDSYELCDDALLRGGRQCLLASLDHAELQSCLRTLWWPELLNGATAMPSTETARAAIAWAIAHAPAQPETVTT